ncbi:MAG: hypothetical protein ACJ768_10310 [Gaiellaceae bacterium]
MPDWQEAYPAVYNRLAEQYRSLPEDQVESLLESMFGEGFGLAAAEGFFDDVGRTLSGAARAAAPVLQRALPGVMSGAMSGAALGPWGMLGGALLGGVGSALGGGGGAAAPHPGAPAPAAGAPALGGGALGGGPTGALGQLLGALGSPTVQQALGSMFLGSAGARTVPTPGGNQLPVAAITNLLGMLSNRASAEWEAIMPSEDAESVGEGLDLASPEVRSAWVFEQLAPVEGLDEAAESADGESVDEAWVDELYDELEAELLAGTEAYDEAYDESAGDEAWRLGAHG